jgi:hypothetical protein
MPDDEFQTVYEALCSIVTDKMCTKMLRHLYTSISKSERLSTFFTDDSLVFENASNSDISRCFRMTINGDNDRNIVISIAIASDRMGNIAQYGEVYLNNHTRLCGNPQTLEILIKSSPSDLNDELGYDGDIRSFGRNNCSSENGFSELIDEIIRIYRILNPSSLTPDSSLDS